MPDPTTPAPSKPEIPATTEDKIDKLGDEIDALEKEALPAKTKPEPIGGMVGD